MNILQLIALLTFFTMMLFSTGVTMIMKERKHKAALYLERYTQDVKEERQEKTYPRFRAFSQFLAPRRWINKAELELAQGDIPLRPEEYITLRILLVTFVALFFFFLGFDLIVNSLLILAATFMPGFLLKKTKLKRQQKFNNQLEEGLTVVTNSLRAGLSFLQAVDTLSKEMPPPLSTEFARLLKEVNLGVPLETALDSLLVRVASDDLDLVITAIKIQRQVGGNLAEVLDNIGETIRERIKLKRNLKTLTAQGKISGIIIALLPFFIIAILAVINPAYMMILVTHPVGPILIAVALSLEISGFLLVRKIVSIDF